MGFIPNISCEGKDFAINMFRGGCADLKSCDTKCLPPVTLINHIQSPPKIFHINGDPPYIVENFVWYPP